tara:strand:- start:1463 stop:1870 length:408 start_codon:yes stop_codon:yes gene_type:complete
MSIDEQILDCINTVSLELGNFYREAIYQNALVLELQSRNISCQTEVVVDIKYKGVYVGFERADIVIYNNSKQIIRILELKSQTSKISTKEEKQLSRYLINLECPEGYVVNFYDVLEIKKVNKEDNLSLQGGANQS